MDCMVLSLFRLSDFYMREIKRSYYGMGSYTLRPHLVDKYDLKRDNPVLEDPIKIEEIVDKERNSKRQYDVSLFSTKLQNYKSCSYTYSGLGVYRSVSSSHNICAVRYKWLYKNSNFWYKSNYCTGSTGSRVPPRLTRSRLEEIR
jgi:hypothetical protein